MEFPFGRVHHLRVLLAIRSRGPLKFNEVQEHLDLAPTQVQRTVNDLRRDLYVHPRPYAKRGRKALLEYELSKKGKAYLDAFDAFVLSLEEDRNVVGEKPIQRLKELYA